MSNKKDVSTEQRDAWVRPARCECGEDGEHPKSQRCMANPAYHAGRIHITSPAMLGEALRLLHEARDLMQEAGLEPMGGLLYDLDGVIERVESRREVYAKREAETRKG